MSISKHTAIGFMAGNREAIEKVYLEYKNLMFFVIAAYVKNKDDCDDILSEAFLKAVESKDQIKDPAKIKPFLCSIAKNKAIDFMKKSRILPSSDLIDEIYGEEERSNPVLNMIEPLLSNKETIIVYLRAIHSYSWEEIVQETCIPESSARRIYSIAKDKLRKELLWA
jgi:RNA polymerase sigma-70 factor (ECF subfamily)